MPLNLNTETVGEEHSQTILILHGLFGSASNWRRIARVLAENYRVISVDMRNHGESPWDDDMSYPAMAGDIAGLIDRRGLVRPHVIGHSMGGKTVMTMLAGEIPLGQVFVVDIAPVAYTHDFHDLVQAMLSVDLSQLKSRNAADVQLASAIPDSQLRAFLIQNLRRADEGFEWRINLRAMAVNMRSLVGYPRLVPSDHHVTFVAGGESDYIQPQYHAAINALFPDHELVTIPGAKHWVHAEKPDELLKVLGGSLTV